MSVRVFWLRANTNLLSESGAAKFKGMKNNCTQEVLLGALVAGADKGFLQEAVAAMNVL